jgi:hypothetical protein
VEQFLSTPRAGSYQWSSGSDIFAITSSLPSCCHTTWGQSHLPPKTNITRPYPSSRLVITGSPGGSASSRSVIRNRLSCSTSTARRCLSGNASLALISRFVLERRGREGGARDASHPKRSSSIGRSYFSLPSRQILSGVQMTLPPASKRTRASEAGSGSHTRWTTRCKLSPRRPAWARMEPHGCGET